ncbi:methylated-DNA--protein-cysteine methyltransferase-like protein [Leptotrombidium deliense]|uniref:Methylated-DNA--protein-cysteine methyltransferase n=1 Tax=Leptotrombidium deliense TaxID=299467 RepID=A0A443SR90_9ACAR|nr:methylated-DNA--protein-cysteine methyltransferase-like protein [Leptotrombidium deliense]
MKSECVLSKRFINTKIGEIEVIGCATGLHAVNLSSVNKRQRCDSCDNVNSLNESIHWLQLYFDDCSEEIKDLMVPKICESGRSSVYLNIWKELSKTEIGETLSYSDLSERVFGHRNASRVVGTAMRRNPCPIIIPCHRVIKANGELGNYSCGNDIKAYLINYEKVHSTLKGDNH